ncbi:hypothetical protein [Wohlfahrtiimonas populi]|uniref:hypothetical protein n=1 Tax=Wohlfahrtiimonas populi TaxID=1940240 RepID=UPI00098CFBBE|nr:hypothetical protein [Wohlfahrtiimonas populi]
MNKLRSLVSSMLQLTRYIQTINFNDMNTKQNFYATTLSWLFVLAFIVIPLLYRILSNFIMNQTLDNFDLYFILPLTILSILLTLKGFKDWRKSNISISSQEIILYSGIRKKLIIPWKNIQSLQYTIIPNQMRILLGYRSEHIIITYYDHHVTLQTKQIPLANFFKYSQKSAFEMIESQYFKNTQRIKEPKTPKLNEVVKYNALNIFSSHVILILCIVLFLGITIITENLYTMLALIAMIPYFLYSNYKKHRKIALIMTQDGIQDQWLYQRNTFIAWADIQAISMNDYNNAYFMDTTPLGRVITITLKDQNIYSQKCNVYQRLLLKFGQENKQTPFLITENLQDYSLDEILIALQQNLSRFTHE